MAGFPGYDEQRYGEYNRQGDSGKIREKSAGFRQITIIRIGVVPGSGY
jgi:hypothetical protein